MDQLLESNFQEIQLEPLKFTDFYQLESQLELGQLELLDTLEVDFNSNTQIPLIFFQTILSNISPS